MATMTQQQVQAVAAQGWAIRRTISAILLVNGVTVEVTVLGELKGGALIARSEDNLIAHKPVEASRLVISDEDAAHLDSVLADVAAQQAGRFFSGGSTSSDHRTNWGVGGRRG